MEITSGNNIPIGMLITEVTFLQDDSAELFGFWYYKEKALPETGRKSGSSPLISLPAGAAD